ncbi:MAG: Rpn family recombination-promoting nuclease/putative transposase [Treponema sp.]|jgi:predicted transposase/invertase (TIGR01784 family)|nr:Rpn family recombination-promoting nuclease/putative transposase [Treponema sp.]
MENCSQQPQFSEVSPFPADIRERAREKAAQGKRLNLLQDIVFKMVFTANDHDSRLALKSLISTCIHRQVSNVTVLNAEIPPEYLTGKTVRFDVRADFNDGESADLEMQMELGGDDILARAVFYATRLLSGQVHRGDNYRDLKRVYQIFFINKELFPGSPLFPRRYHLMEDTEHDRLNNLIEILFYELPKLEGKAQALVERREEAENLSDEERWCMYMMYQKDEDKAELIKTLIGEDEGLMSTEKVLDKVSRDREEWAKALSRELAEMDYRSGMDNAERKGKEAKAYEVARNLITRIGLPLEQVAEATGLDLAIVQSLAQTPR